MKRLFLFLTAILLCAATMHARKPLAKHVVMIAIDGWGGYSLKHTDSLPNIRTLMDEGCWTARKRSVLPSSSAINWASMFNGCPTEVHGYTKWNSRRPEIPSRWEGPHGIIPTIYTLLGEQMPAVHTACIYEWDGIKHLIDTLAVTHHALSVDYEKHPSQIIDMAEACILNDAPTFLSVCLDGLDHEGHAAGHDTPGYYAKLREYDGYIGRILKTIRQTAWANDCIVILTADHGGIKKTHGGASLSELETPFIIAGKHVKRGGEFEESMMQYDTAATIAYIFGLKQPQVWTGRPMTQVFK